MFIGSLLDNRSESKISYSYHKRGIQEIYNPDKVKEETDNLIFTKENGNLFFEREVSWHDHALLREGVDIKFKLDETCFIDHLTLVQGDSYITNPDVLRTKDSMFESIEIITCKNDEEKIIAKYTGETGNYVSSKEITVNVGFYCDNLIIRINGCCMPLSIKKLDIWAAWGIEDAIFPLPDKHEALNSSYSLDDLKTILVKNENEEFVADYLNEKLLYKFNHTLVKDKNKGDVEITFGKEEKDSFSIISENGRCNIFASNRRSALYGVDAFLQTIKNNRVNCCKVNHIPYKDIRGVHFALPNKDQLSFMENLIKYVFVPNHYNMLYLQLSGAMRYKKFPEINEEWVRINEEYETGNGPMPAHYGFIGKDIWEQEEVSSLCRLFESYGIEVVPEIQSFGHAQYITCAYPEVAEKKEEKEDLALDIGAGELTPSTSFYHVMCPNHPKYYEILFGIIDEVIETVKPKRYIHMGHDEIHNYGFCPACEGMEKSNILAKEINTLNAYIKEKGFKMMIWGDMVQHQYYSTPSAINKLDKDIIMFDFIWYFHTDEDTEDNLLSHGFEVIMGNMYSSHYTRYKKRIAKENMLGAQTSTWLEMSEKSYAYNGKFYEFIYSGLLMSSKNYREDMRLSYNEIIKPIIKGVREKIGNLTFSGNQESISFSGASKNIPFDIRDTLKYNNAIKLDSLHNETTVMVEDYIDCITITHATDIDAERKMWAEPKIIGEYIITYEDGTVYKEDICYAEEIYKYKSVYGDIIKEDHFRHLGYQGTYLTIPECGKTSLGEDFTLYKYSFRNLESSKKIKSLTFKHLGNTGAKIIIFDISINKL